jgi:hypothetical protein
MYCLIEKFKQQIIASIPPNDISEYEWLVQNRQQSPASYQQRYRRFWVMNQAQLSLGFREAYFRELNAATTTTA